MEHTLICSLGCRCGVFVKAATISQSGGDMVARINTVAFAGIEVRHVDVQVQIGAGLPAFTSVGLPDKAVSEARERVRGPLRRLFGGK